jgi:uncharacterized protein
VTLNKLPALDADNHAFWTHGENSTLAICRCKKCQHFIHPPSPVCVACGSMDVASEPVSGRASVISFSVNFQPWVAGQAVPFVLATVELVEQKGLWIMTNIVGCDPQTVHVDMPVQVCFEQQDDIWLPLFAPEGKQ